MAEFGNRLRDLRIAHNMSQDEVAAAINVTRQAISKWETDHGLPDVTSLGSLAELFDTTVDFLLTGEEKVRVEKEIEVVEVEKEKLVEVEKPLSKEMLKALLMSYREWYKATYSGIIMGPISFIAGLCFFIPSVLHLNLNNSLIVTLLIGILFIILGIVAPCVGMFYSRKRLIKIKHEIELKTGKKVDFWGYKDE